LYDLPRWRRMAPYLAAGAGLEQYGIASEQPNGTLATQPRTGVLDQCRRRRESSGYERLGSSHRRALVQRTRNTGLGALEGLQRRVLARRRKVGPRADVSRSARSTVRTRVRAVRVDAPKGLRQHEGTSRRPLYVRSAVEAISHCGWRSSVTRTYRARHRPARQRYNDHGRDYRGALCGRAARVTRNDEQLLPYGISVYEALYRSPSGEPQRRSIHARTQRVTCRGC
jgi:hypothetical protein